MSSFLFKLGFGLIVAGFILLLFSCNPMDCSPSGSCPWDSPGKNTRVGCHFLLQGIFLIQGLSLLLLHLLHWHEDSLPLSHLGSPGFTVQALNFVEIHKARMECRSWELSWYSGIWMTPCEKSSPVSDCVPVDYTCNVKSLCRDVFDSFRF